MKTLITLALIATASTAAADYQPYNYAYEATMMTLGSNDTLAHEFANCPVRSGSKDQLFAISQSTGQARENAINAVFEASPAAVGCLLEVLLRYDLITAADLTR